MARVWQVQYAPLIGQLCSRGRGDRRNCEGPIDVGAGGSAALSVMVKKARPESDAPADKAVIMGRMKRGLKRLLNTPPETHEETIRRRRGEGMARWHKETR